jgi:hypothetical protein
MQMYKYYSNNRKNPPLCASFATASATLKHLILWEFRAITDPVIRLIRPITLIHRYLRR